MRPLLLAAILSLIFPLYAAAAEVTIKLDPKNPEPYSTVNLILLSYDIDVNTSMVVWKVAGKEAKRGMGGKTFSISLGPPGTQIPVSAIVSDASGNVLQSSVTLTPQSVTLLWESIESYTPPFYEGKPLPAEGSKIKVSAFPSINAPLEALSYSWYVGDSALESSSGAGKRSVPITLEILTDETEIRSVVRSSSGAIAEKTITVIPHAVMPLIYSSDDLFGPMVGKLFSRRLEVVGETMLTLEPYYLSTRAGLDRTALYNWYLDGLPVTPQEKTTLALRPKAGVSGVRTLSIVVENTKRRLQKAQADLQVVFDTR
jgi:hypothetical protein